MSDYTTSTVAIPLKNNKGEERIFNVVTLQDDDIDEREIPALRKLGFKRFYMGHPQPYVIFHEESYEEIRAFLNYGKHGLIDEIHSALRWEYSSGATTQLCNLGKTLLRQEAKSFGGNYHFLSEFQIKYKSGYYTFAGTNTSINNNKQQGRKKWQLTHIERYLKLIFLGEANSTLDIPCAYSGQSIVSVDQYIGVNDVDLDLHHISNFDGQSCYKNPYYEPSSYLTASYISNDCLFELMTTVPLCGRPHTKVHSYIKQGHDVEFFIRLWGLWEPDKLRPDFIFKSRENYEYVCKWLEKYDDRPNFLKQYPYSEFVKRISYRNDRERDICERAIRKFFKKVELNKATAD